HTTPKVGWRSGYPGCMLKKKRYNCCSLGIISSSEEACLLLQSPCVMVMQKAVCVLMRSWLLFHAKNSECVNCLKSEQWLIDHDSI
ncbi:hypothetical protein STEG23_012083, partial [Scotinomys teguina]